MPVNVPCAWCGNLVKLTPSKAKTNNRAFCNRAHMLQWMRSPQGKRALFQLCMDYDVSFRDERPNGGTLLFWIKPTH